MLKWVFFFVFAMSRCLKQVLLKYLIVLQKQIRVGTIGPCWKSERSHTGCYGSYERRRLFRRKCRQFNPVFFPQPLFTQRHPSRMLSAEDTFSLLEMGEGGCGEQLSRVCWRLHLIQKYGCGYSLSYNLKITDEASCWVDRSSECICSYSQ